MAKAPAFQFYAKDWLAGTGDMTCAERGVYITLLARQWEDGSLPAESKRLAMIANCPHDEFVAYWLAISGKFVVGEDGRLRNMRLERTRAEMEEFRAKKVIAAMTRWDKHTNAKPMQTPCTASANTDANGMPAFASATATATAKSKAKATTPQAALPVIPDWVPKKPWEAFLEMRKRMRCPPTAHAYGLLIEKLDRLRSSGQDPGAVLDQSTEHNWRGLFPIRGATNGSGSPKSAAERRQEREHGAIANWLRRENQPSGSAEHGGTEGVLLPGRPEPRDD